MGEVIADSSLSALAYTEFTKVNKFSLPPARDGDTAHRLATRSVSDEYFTTEITQTAAAP